MPTLKNINPLGAVDLPLLGRSLEQGEEFEVSDEVAGRGPTPAQVDKDGAVTTLADPGSGLLAQAGNYELVAEKKKG